MLTIPKPLMPKVTAPRLTARVMAVALCGFGAVALTPATAWADDAGSFWTQFTPSVDTRLVFVSSSEGSDTNNGLSPSSPVKTLDRAYALLRDGHPDWMLLRRGDVWYESIPNWHKSGRDDDEKMILGAYGDSAQRPKVRPAPDAVGLHGLGDGTVSHLAFVGFHLEPQQRGADDSGTGIRWMQSCDDLLFEDLYIDGFKDNITFQAYPADNTLEDIRVNGCVVVDAWSNTGHSQGLFASGVDGLIVENSVFDHNGFNEAEGALPTMFNHNLYVQNNNQGVVIRNNVIADASSHGIQLRCGGIIDNNLFISNPLAALFGGGTNPNQGGVEGAIRNNLVMYGRDLNDDLPRAYGFTLSNIRQADVTNNIFHISTVGYNRDAIKIGGDRDLMVQNLLIDSNVVLDWQGSFTVADPSAGQIMSNISLSNNAFFRDMRGNSNGNLNKPFVMVHDDWMSSVEVAENQYHHYGMHDRPFKVGGTRTDADEWRQMVEPSASFHAMSTPPSEFGLDEYMQSIGRSGGTDAFMSSARQMSRSQPQLSYSANRVIGWFASEINAAGFRVAE